MNQQNNFAPQIKGYRIVYKENIEANADKFQTQTFLKVILDNKSNGLPKIRHDVVCQGKIYKFIPLFNFTNESDLKILEQISTIELKDQVAVLCQILSGSLNRIKASQFLDVKRKMKDVFDLQLKLDLEQIFTIVISQQIVSQQQVRTILDALSETQFVNLIRKIYQNCPGKVIPKILRKFIKYFNSSKNRQKGSILRLKSYLKVVKSSDSAQIEYEVPQQADFNQQQQYEEKLKVQKQKVVENVEKINVNGKQLSVNDKTQKKKLDTVQKTKEQPKPKQQSSVKYEQKINKKQKYKLIEKKDKIQKVAQKKQEKPPAQNEQDWHDIDEKSNQDSEEFEDRLNDMILPNQDEEGYRKPNKQNKNKNSNITIPLDPEFQRNLGRKPQPLKKQKNNKNTSSNTGLRDKGSKGFNNQASEQNNFKQKNDRPKYKKNNQNQTNGSGSIQKGKREWSKQNKKIDPRILLGINGASDSVWRERMRPPKFIKKEDGLLDSRKRIPKGESRKQINEKGTNKQLPTAAKTTESNLSDLKVSNDQTNNISKDLNLQKIFSIPEDSSQGKIFKFENRNYNLFINKLFWVNITQGQVIIQKQGKGYIRKCSAKIIDEGNGITADGLTLIIDGLSNLQDGGTPFGDPNFEEFTPEGQWFHVNSIQVYAYV